MVIVQVPHRGVCRLVQPRLRSPSWKAARPRRDLPRGLALVVHRSRSVQANAITRAPRAEERIVEAVSGTHGDASDAGARRPTSLGEPEIAARSEWQGSARRAFKHAHFHSFGRPSAMRRECHSTSASQARHPSRRRDQYVSRGSAPLVSGSASEVVARGEARPRLVASQPRRPEPPAALACDKHHRGAMPERDDVSSSTSP